MCDLILNICGDRWTWGSLHWQKRSGHSTAGMDFLQPLEVESVSYCCVRNDTKCSSFTQLHSLACAPYLWLSWLCLIHISLGSSQWPFLCVLRFVYWASSEGNLAKALPHSPVREQWLTLRQLSYVQRNWRDQTKACVPSGLCLELTSQSLLSARQSQHWTQTHMEIQTLLLWWKELKQTNNNKSHILEYRVRKCKELNH